MQQHETSSPPGQPGRQEQFCFDIFAESADFLSDHSDPSNDVADVREGVWRGDPSRPVVLIDTPGLCADEEDDAEADTRIVIEIVNILKKFGHINAFVIVLKSGQSRYVGKIWPNNITLLFAAR